MEIEQARTVLRFAMRAVYDNGFHILETDGDRDATGKRVHCRVAPKGTNESVESLPIYCEEVRCGYEDTP